MEKERENREKYGKREKTRKNQRKNMGEIWGKYGKVEKTEKNREKYGKLWEKYGKIEGNGEKQKNLENLEN